MIEELEMNIALATSDPHAVLEKLQGAGNPGLFFLTEY